MSSEPKRIQRKRTKGWRMPEGAVYVGRPSKWGNTFRPVRCDRRIHDDGFREIFKPHWHLRDDSHVFGLRWETRTEAMRWAVNHFKIRFANPEFDFPIIEEIRDELAGRDLACWCPLDQPCHGDVLLEIANDTSQRKGAGE